MSPDRSHSNDPTQHAAISLTTAEQDNLDLAASILQAVGYDSWDALDPIVPARCLLAVDYLCLAGAQPAQLSILDTAADVRRAITAAADLLDRLPAEVRATEDVGSATSLVDHARSAF